MVSALLLSFALASDGTGAVPEAGAEVLAARKAVRPRLAIALAGAGGYGSAFPGLVVSGGLTGDLGVTLGDELSLSARATVALGLGATLLGGLAVDWALGEQLQLGVGLSFALVGGMLDQSINGGGVLPVRVAWMFSKRAAAVTARSGFFVFGELAPGVSFLGSPGYFGRRGGGNPVGFLVAASVGFGYASW